MFAGPSTHEQTSPIYSRRGEDRTCTLLFIQRHTLRFSRLLRVARAFVVCPHRCALASQNAQHFQHLFKHLTSRFKTHHPRLRVLKLTPARARLRGHTSRHLIRVAGGAEAVATRGTSGAGAGAADTLNVAAAPTRKETGALSGRAHVEYIRLYTPSYPIYLSFFPSIYRNCPLPSVVSCPCVT